MARAKKTTKKSTKAEEGADSATGVETLLEELDAVVNELEQGELPLEQALERFERGGACGYATVIENVTFVECF